MCLSLASFERASAEDCPHWQAELKSATSSISALSTAIKKVRKQLESLSMDATEKARLRYELMVRRMDEEAALNRRKYAESQIRALSCPAK